MKRLYLTDPRCIPHHRPKPPVEPRVKAMDTLDTQMHDILQREDLPTDERLKLYDQSLYRYLNVHNDYRPKPQPTTSVPPPSVVDTVEDSLEKEILDSVPKALKGKAELLLKKMKSSPDISWNEKGELRHKGEIVKGSNVVDLVNDVLRKRKYFNPEGWETFGDALREANVPQDLIGHEDRWKYIRQMRKTPRARKRQQSPSPETPKRRTPKKSSWTPY